MRDIDPSSLPSPLLKNYLKHSKRGKSMGSQPSLRIRFCSLILLGMMAGCFTGEELAGKPCKSNDDCVVMFGLSGLSYSCRDEVCSSGECGDGVLQPGEECDDGKDGEQDDECTDLCTKPTCGDNFLQSSRMEECDDGNDDPSDFCVECKLPACGDKYKNGNEECDESDLSAHPVGCSQCLISICGDNNINKYTESCDDGNLEDNDGCSGKCLHGATAISKGSTASHTCAIRNGELVCWGKNDHFRLGRDDTAVTGDEPQDLPLTQVKLRPGVGVLAVAAGGGGHTCILSTDGDVSCWGHNFYGQADPFLFQSYELINNSTYLSVANIVDLGDSGSKQIAAGTDHSCALTNDGKLYCWGRFDQGQLTPNGTISHLPQIASVNGNDSWAQVVAGGAHTCALNDMGEVYCWGMYEMSSIDNPEMPRMVMAREIAAGRNHSCALGVDGTLRCWGYSESCNMGDGETGVVQGIESWSISHVVAGGNNTCAVRKDGKVGCWGAFYAGALALPPEAGGVGCGGRDAVIVPIEEPAIDLHVGEFYTCALVDGGQVKCWGLNSHGQLGIGSTSNIGDDINEKIEVSPIYPKPEKAKGG